MSPSMNSYDAMGFHQHNFLAHTQVSVEQSGRLYTAQRLEPGGNRRSSSSSFGQRLKEARQKVMQRGRRDRIAWQRTERQLTTTGG